MNGEFCRQREVNYSNKDITRGFFPFSTGATLNRNSEGFLISARPNKSGTIFFTLFLFLVLSGCGPSRAELEKEQLAKREISQSVSVIKVDSCEYILYSHTICHKQNCKNCSTKKITHE